MLVLDCQLVAFSPYAELVGSDDPLEPGMFSILRDTFSMGLCVCVCGVCHVCVHLSSLSLQTCIIKQFQSHNRLHRCTCTTTCSSIRTFNVLCDCNIQHVLMCYKLTLCRYLHTYIHSLSVDTNVLYYMCVLYI